MGRRLAKNKITGNIAQGYLPKRRQSVGFDLTQIDHKGYVDRCPGRRMQKPEATRLDQSADGRGGSGNQCTRLIGEQRAIICDQNCAQRHQSQTKRRFARPRGPDDQHAPFCNRNTGRMYGVQDHRARLHQIGKPTTKRAPSGSEVISAWVGRMFSAQITPPCASTICLEIARPRPEWLPNWPSGRSE